MGTTGHHAKQEMAQGVQIHQLLSKAKVLLEAKHHQLLPNSLLQAKLQQVANHNVLVKGQIWYTTQEICMNKPDYTIMYI